MVPARRFPVDRLEPNGVSERAFQSGIQLKEPSAAYALIGARIPPHDPLPRIAYDEDEDVLEERSQKYMFAKALPTVTCESGAPIAIAPSAASISVLSSNPPREASQPPVAGDEPVVGDEPAEDATLHFALAFIALTALATAVAALLLG